MISAFIEGIGIRGPGLADWPSACEALLGSAPYVCATTVLAPPLQLPPAERRRVGKGVKLALAVGFEAVAHAGRDAAQLASVFASSSGDGDNCGAICEALAGDRLISPTRFHNSVHNTPSGYWGIAAHAMAASTSLCAFDASFAVGLVDAMTQMIAADTPVLMVAYDAPYPEPLFATRPVPELFGIALVLAPRASARSFARIELGMRGPADAQQGNAANVPALDDATLEHWRASIPAARGLALLAALATISSSPSAGRQTAWLEDVNGALLPVRVFQGGHETRNGKHG